MSFFLKVFFVVDGRSYGVGCEMGGWQSEGNRISKRLEETRGCDVGYLPHSMEARPSRHLEGYWFFHTEGASPKTFIDEECGKWMLFYSPAVIDERWEAAKRALRSGILQGVVSMKVSTAKAVAENAQQQQQQGRGSYNANHVVIFYCGPAGDKETVMSVGRRVARAMNPSVKSMYFPPPPALCCRYLQTANVSPSPSLRSYKSDQQTLAGQYSGGGQKCTMSAASSYHAVSLRRFTSLQVHSAPACPALKPPPPLCPNQAPIISGSAQHRRQRPERCARAVA